MRNLIPHPMISLDQNLSKITGRYIKNTKKNSFFMIPITKFILKIVYDLYGISNLMKFHWLTHDEMQFELWLKGPF